MPSRLSNLPNFSRISLAILTAIAVAILGYLYTPVQEWDEARRGINLVLMVQHGDYLNYRYLDGYDTFNTKPPLFLWASALVYLVVDDPLIAIRSVSLLCFFAFLLGSGHCLKKRFGTAYATLFLLVVASCRGILRTHVAYTGDTDMMFVLFTVAGVLAYYRLWRDPRPKHVYLPFLLLFLAFLTKGIAVALVVPGMIVYALLDGRYRSIDRLVLRAVGINVLVYGSASVLLLGNLGERIPYADGSRNLLEAMLFNDGVTRFSNPDFEAGYDPEYLLVALDLSFTPYVYFLYGFGAWLLFRRISGRPGGFRLSDFGTLSALVAASVLVLLFFSANKHQWYVAPAIVFLSVVVTEVLRFGLGRIGRCRYLLFGPLYLMLMYRGFDAVRSGDIRPVHRQTPGKFELRAEELTIPADMPQNIALQLVLANPGATLVEPTEASDRFVAATVAGQSVRYKR